jgi:hypothetical protein
MGTGLEGARDYRRIGAAQQAGGLAGAVADARQRTYHATAGAYRPSMSVSTPCIACDTGPAEIDGHADLCVQSMGDDGVVFKCQACQAMWTRSYSQTHRYIWSPHPAFGHRLGTAVPPQSPPAD